jgi:hypothetical protein
MRPPTEAALFHGQIVSVGLNQWEPDGAYRYDCVRRSHNRPRTAALSPRFCQTMGASSGKPPEENPMDYSQSPPIAEPLDEDAIYDQRISRRPVNPSIQSPRSSRFEDDRVASDRPSLGGRMSRTFARFFITVLIGVGGTLAWQSDTAREMMVTRAPTLAWLLSVSTTTSSAVAATSADPVQQLEPLASNLDVVRRSVEQLADKQDQMAQNIAALQAVEEDIRQKMSFTPPSPSQQPAPIPQHKPQQPRAQSSSAPRPPPPAGPVELPR